MGKNHEKELTGVAQVNSGLNVMVYKNNLTKDGTNFIRVQSKLANVKMVLAQVEEDNPNANLAEIKKSLEIYNNAAIKLLKKGYSVKILDLGVLKITHHGSIKSKEEAANITDFTAEFDVDKSVLDAVKGLEVDAVLEFDNSAHLTEIADLRRKVSDGKITKGAPMAVYGIKLKVDENADEIYFVPQDENEENLLDKEQWIKLSMGDLFRNKPTELNIIVPQALTAGEKYRLMLRRACIDSNGKKVVISSESDVFEAFN